MSDLPTDPASASNPVTPFGPVDPDLKDSKRSPSAEEAREILLCNATRCLYEGLKSLMEAVVIGEEKAQPGQSVPAAGTEPTTDFGASPEPATPAPSPASEPPQPLVDQAAEDLDQLNHQPTIACWTEAEAVPPVILHKPMEEVAEASEPVSPFANTAQIQNPAQIDWDELSPESKITSINPLSLTELQPSSEPPEAVSPFSVVKEEAPSAHTSSHLTPDSIPAGEGTPAGPDSVTDPLEGQQAFEIPKPPASKEKGSYPFQNTIPRSKPQQKAG